ncbi:hypothetical protein GCM10010466_39550 [Planomonospora alba]|uniref:Uncharacterized protein n=1 Tax=Planomonospora alba TaxID=161354 RepID=A0ABP6NEE8_9ACTN
MIPLSLVDATAERVVAVAHATLEEFDGRPISDYLGGEAAFRLGELSLALRSVLALLPYPEETPAPRPAWPMGRAVSIGSLTDLPRPLFVVAPEFNDGWPVKVSKVHASDDGTVAVDINYSGTSSGRVYWPTDRIVLPLKWEDAE